MGKVSFADMDCLLNFVIQSVCIYCFNLRQNGFKFCYNPVTSVYIKASTVHSGVIDDIASYNGCVLLSNSPILYNCSAVMDFI